MILFSLITILNYLLQYITLLLLYFFVRIQVRINVFPLISSFKSFFEQPNIHFIDPTWHIFLTVLYHFDSFSCLITRFNMIVSHDNQPLLTSPGHFPSLGFTDTFWKTGFNSLPRLFPAYTACSRMCLESNL